MRHGLTDRTVLVVEDDDDIREIVDLILTMNGYGSVLARDGVEALEQLRSGTQPALILLDLRMPRLDGEGLVARLRQDPRWADIPVIVLSGEAGAQAVSVALGAQGFLGKPVEVSELVDTVEDCLDHHDPDGLAP